jgi:hypothetical protein
MENFWRFLKLCINNGINKYGMDKLLHFFVGAWITALAYPFGFFGPILAFLFVTFISFVKEYYIDDIPDMYDIYAGMAGSFISMIILLLLTIII